MGPRPAAGTTTAATAGVHRCVRRTEATAASAAEAEETSGGGAAAVIAAETVTVAIVAGTSAGTATVTAAGNTTPLGHPRGARLPRASPPVLCSAALRVTDAEAAHLAPLPRLNGHLPKLLRERRFG